MHLLYILVKMSDREYFHDTIAVDDYDDQDQDPDYDDGASLNTSSAKRKRGINMMASARKKSRSTAERRPDASLCTENDVPCQRCAFAMAVAGSALSQTAMDDNRANFVICDVQTNGKSS